MGRLLGAAIWGGYLAAANQSIRQAACAANACASAGSSTFRSASSLNGGLITIRPEPT